MYKTPILRITAMIAAMLCAVLSAAPSLAGDIVKPRGVVELFTSQGCSSCPPADAVLAELVRQGDVVALGYHVDYWDYLGWKDTLARPENTERQKLYGQAFGKHEVYTPQAVINGRLHVKGGMRDTVQAALSEFEQTGKGMVVDIKVTRTGESLLIDAGEAPGRQGDAHLILVQFDAARPVLIERGANKGQTISYVNPVVAVQAAGMWHGKAARFELPRREIEKKGGCAILLQEVGKDGLPGPILGAAVLSPEDGAR